MKKSILLIPGAILIIVSCSKSGTTGGGGNNGGGGSLDCTGVNAAFAANVNPIIQGSCATNASCHGTGSNNGPGPLLTYTQIFNARAAIRGSVAAGTMPKTGTITTQQKNSILCWVDAGAPNN